MIKGIYFVDGEFIDVYWLAVLGLSKEDNIPYEIIDATHGVTQNLTRIKEIQNYPFTERVITNSILLLNNEYGWNDESSTCEVYIYDHCSKEFINVQNLTDKEIRKAHNLAKMYVAGSFNSENYNFFRAE
jgi:hypothetical protein